MENGEFVYLAAVLDAYSRRVIGWGLGRTLEAALWLEAVEMALGQRHPISAGVVHHSAQVDSVYEVRRSTTERAFTRTVDRTSLDAATLDSCQKQWISG